MPKLVKEYINNFSQQDLYDLVANIEDYPEFIPWIVGARIKKREVDFVLAELLIKYKFFRSQYISKVFFYPNERIFVELAEGPFKYLWNEWKFFDGKLEFTLEFELVSDILNDLITIEFEKYAEKIMNCFIERAQLVCSK